MFHETPRRSRLPKPSLGKRERSPKHKNYAVGQSQLGNAAQVSRTESAMDKPHHGGPVFMITRRLPAR